MEADILRSLQHMHLSKKEGSGVPLEDGDFSGSLEECERSLLGKIHGDKKVSFQGLKLTMSSLWKLSSELKVREVGPNTFQFTFPSKQEAVAVLNGRSWTFAGQFLVLRSWQEEEEKNRDLFRFVKVWVQVWHLPISWLSKSVGRKIGSMFWKTWDVQIPDIGSSSGRHMKLLVDLDLFSPLPRGTKVFSGDQERWVLFKYEQIPNFCVYCGKVGHSVMNCSTKKEAMTAGQDSEDQYGDWLRASTFQNLKQEQQLRRQRKSLSVQSNGGNGSLQEAGVSNVGKLLHSQGFKVSTQPAAPQPCIEQISFQEAMTHTQSPHATTAIQSPLEVTEVSQSLQEPSTNSRVPTNSNPTYNQHQPNIPTFPLVPRLVNPMKPSFNNKSAEVINAIVAPPNTISSPPKVINPDANQTQSKDQLETLPNKTICTEAIQGDIVLDKVEHCSEAKVQKPYLAYAVQEAGPMELDFQHLLVPTPLHQLSPNAEGNRSSETQLVTVPIWSFPESRTVQALDTLDNCPTRINCPSTTAGKKRTLKKKEGKENRAKGVQIGEQANIVVQGSHKRSRAMGVQIDEAGLCDAKKAKRGDQLEDNFCQEVG